jgi:pimeloyl-ACP methyl ester carboxylesterase
MSRGTRVNSWSLRFKWLCLTCILAGQLVAFTNEAPARADETRPAVNVELLPPTGPLSLGRTSYHWGDASPEKLASKIGPRCEVMAHIWYPARQAAGTPAPYLPEFSTIQAAIGEATLRAEAGAGYDALSAARTHVVADAPLSSDPNKYPVLLLTHGLRYSSLGYSMLGEDLASHGYVVVGVDHPATAFAVVFPDKRQTRFPEAVWTRPRTSEETSAFEQENVNLCAADLVFVLDQLERLESGELPSQFQGRLDLARVGVLGHSFGGRVAARACQLDKRLKAAAILDSFGRRMTVQRNPDGSTLEQPVVLFATQMVPDGGFARVVALLQNGGKNLDEELRPVRKEFCQSVRGACYEVVLNTPAISHESFSDMPLLESGQSELTRKNRQRAMDITRGYTRAFFDRYLRNSPAPMLDNPPDNPREIELTRHTFRGQ